MHPRVNGARWVGSSKTQFAGLLVILEVSGGKEAGAASPLT
jgi:hypothetical protein